MKVVSHRGRLYLHGTFPRKDGQPGNAQYKVTLQLEDTFKGQREAAKQLTRAKNLLKKGEWDWNDWLINTKHTPGKEHGAETWRAAIRVLYKRKVLLGRCKEESWHTNYMGTLKLMPQNEKVTTASMKQQLERYSRDTYTYKKLYGLLKHIADITGQPFPEVAIPLYDRATTIYEIPDDQYIIDWVLSAAEPYRWYFGMMATYGLRPHECDECRMVWDENGKEWIVQVDNKTKTGYRTVIPMDESWVDLFKLGERTVRPASSRDPLRTDGCSVWLNTERLRMGIDYKPYMLRHAYASRLWREGGAKLPLDDAANLMGHSVQEHLNTYRRWIDPNLIAASARDAIRRNRAEKMEAAEKAINQAQESQR